jgi:hypothetical protein
VKTLYASLAIIGFIVSLTFIGLFIAANGFNLGLFFQHLFSNYVSTLFALDLVLSSIIFWVFLLKEAKKHQMNHTWLYIASNLLIGLCFALPLFLYFREARLEKVR